MTVVRYSRTAIILHWLIAGALAFQCGLGTFFADTAKGKVLYDVAQFHKSIGIAILLLSLIRLAVRFIKPRPAPLGDHGWAERLASLGHFGLYAFMIGAPITGWLAVSVGHNEVPTVLFNTIPWPDFPFVSGMGAAIKHDVHEYAEIAHSVIAKLGLLLFLLHIAGALRHQWILKQPLIERMVPVPKPLSRLAGSGLILALAAAFFTLLQYAEATGIAPSAHGLVSSAAPVASLAPAPLNLAPAALKLDASEPGEGDELSTAMTNAAAPDVPAAAKEAATARAPVDATGTANDSKIAIPAGQTPRWTVASGGRLGFVTSWSGTIVNGSYQKWAADIHFNPEALAASKIKVSIDLTSTVSGDSQRDGMLQGEDFFSSTAHPNAVWTSGAIKSLGDNRYRAEGTLSLRGVEKAVPLDFKLIIANKRASVSGSAVLNRTSFGVGQGDYAKTDEIPDAVRIGFNFAADR
jgi:cytochrome b561/polyisoprenoid-binding protein YceI